MKNILVAKYVGGLYAEDKCDGCTKKEHIHYIYQDNRSKIVAQFCVACSLHRDLYDGKKIETSHETTLL